MIPNNTVIRSPNRDDYLHYNKQDYKPLIAEVRGGLDIRDPILGLDVSDWILYFDLETRTFTLDKDDKFVMSLGAPPYGRVPTEIAFAFDEEMRFFWGYSYLDTEGDYTEKRIEFNWFHPEQNMTIKLILDDVQSMKVCLDDRRKSLVDNSDILLVYVRNRDRVVCVRYQRDLFQVEYPLFLLRTGESLIRCDVTVENTLQFEIGKLQKPFTWVKMLDTQGYPLYNHKGHPIWVLENQMAEAYNTRASLSDLTYHRNVSGSESFIVIDKGEEKQATLGTIFGYLRETLTLDNYYTRGEVNGKFAYMTEVYTQSQSHELFETRGNGYSRSETDGRYALKDTSYSKTEIDNLYVKTQDVYNRTTVDTTFATKSSVYTVDETNNLFALKAEITQPVVDFTPYLTRADAAIYFAPIDGVYTPSYIETNFVKKIDLNVYYTKTQIDARFAIKEHTVEPQKDNLLRNGICEYGDKTGWNDRFEYAGYLGPTSPFGAMVFAGPSERLVLDQSIPIMIDKTYRLSYEYRYINKVTPGIDLKIGLQCLDRDRNVIAGHHYGIDKLSTTKLTVPLLVGDLQMRVDDLNGWLAHNPDEFGFGNILFFNYKDSGGYEYRDLQIPYTRNIAFGEYIVFKENENAAADVHLTQIGKIVRFSKPWDYINPNSVDGSFPVGTRLSRSRPYLGPDELEFRCMQAVGKQYDSPASHVLKGTIEFDTKYNTTGAYAQNTLPPGTVYIRPVLYPNYNYLVDKTEYGLAPISAPAATNQDVVAISQLHLKVDF